ncbi:Retrovirus-related Pol polyprotein from transposon, partial [Smittium culicis]
MNNRTLEPKIFRGKSSEDADRFIKRYECFGKSCLWTDSEFVDYLDLFLEVRSLTWYKGITTESHDWESLKINFKLAFTDEDEDILAWNQLITFSSIGKDSVEIKGTLKYLFEKAKIVSPSEKLRYLTKSLPVSLRKKIITKEIHTWEKAIEMIAKEEKTEKLISNSGVSNNEKKLVVKDYDPVETLIQKFDEFSLNMLNRDRGYTYSSQPQPQPPKPTSPRCNNCFQYGHKTEFCKDKSYHQNSNNNPTKKNSYNSNPPPMQKEVSCIEVESKIIHETDIYMAEKRPIIDGQEATPKRSRILDTASTEDLAPEYKDRPKIQSRRPAEIKLSSNTIPYSIGQNLNNAKADLSLAQLLQVAPSLRNELMNLCKRTEPKELNKVDTEKYPNTNCRGLVKIFDERYWAVLDTGAACSVISTTLMNEIGLEADNESNQVVITADGSRHNTVGTVSKIPLKIADIDFPCNALVLDVKKPILILGTEWFSDYKAIIDLRARELILEKDNLDVVLKVFINTPKRRVKDEIEVYGIGLEVQHIKPTPTFPGVDKLIKEYLDIFATELSDLTQTNMIEHSIDTDGIMTNKSKVEAMLKVPHPRNLKELQSFLGMVGYYRKFIPSFSKTAQPLNKLLTKNTKWNWNEDCIYAAEKLKDDLSKSPVLSHPDWNKEFILTTDASINGLGAILSQKHENKEKPIAYGSRSLSSFEKNYSISNLEGLGVVWGIKLFKNYLWGNKFTVVTDHSALVQLFKTKELSGRLARWSNQLRDYSFDIIHRPGRYNPADYLSRNVPEKRELKEWHSREKKEPEIEIFSLELNNYFDIYKFLENFTYPKDLEEPERKKLRNKSKMYILINGELYRKSKNLGNRKVLHDQNAEEKIQEIHNENHNGVANTWERVKSAYYGKGLYKLVKNIVNSCDTCQRYYGSSIKRNEMVPIVALNPFDIVGIDAVGPINPISTNKNRFILTAIDYATKWSIARAVENIQTKTVVNFIITDIVQYFGVPKQLITDRGSNFLSDAAIEFYEFLEIDHTPTTTYRPQANGQVERLNQTLKNTLSKLCSEDKENWDQYIWKALLSVRTMKNRSTGFSPDMLLYGNKLNLPSVWDDQVSDPISETPEADRAKYIEVKLEEFRRIGNQNSINSKNKSAKLYNKNLRKFNFAIYDKVLKHADVLSSKFSAIWEGPFTIVRIGDRGAYTIKDADGNMDI